MQHLGGKFFYEYVMKNRVFLKHAILDKLQTGRKGKTLKLSYSREK